MDPDWIRPRASFWPARVHVVTSTRRSPPADRAPGIERIQWLTQVHGTRCFEADAGTAASSPQADAAWTRARGLGVAVLTADCVPVVLGHRDGSVVGVAHGGWRGLVSGVLGELVAALPVPPAELVAWLGPAIGPDAYEVGDDVVEAVGNLPDGSRLMDDCLRQRGDSRFLDLFTLSQRLLERAGVGAVTSERLCTHSDDRFYSYRRDGRTGRMVTLAWL